MISNWTNLVARRDLLRELISTELKASTAQTRLGWLWWLLDPLLMMVIYWGIVVGVLGRGRADPEIAPYWVFIFYGLLVWKHFSSAASKSTSVLAGRKSLIRAVAFPTMVLPLSSALVAFAFFLFGFLVLGVMSLAAPHPGHTGELLPVLQVPALWILQLLIVVGLVLPLACLGVIFRDLNGLVPHVLRLGFYLSPGLYAPEMVRDKLLSEFPRAGEALFSIYMLNPFAILIEGYRASLFRGTFLAPQHWIVLSVETGLALVAGYLVFQHYDRRVIKFL